MGKLFTIPVLAPAITKEFLLSKNSEETYMQTYLGVPVKKGLLVSPLRNDHRPTASFYRNKSGELIFHDFGVGFHSNFIGIVMHINNCSYGEALRIIAEDFGYIPKNSERNPIKINKTEKKIEIKEDTTIQIENKPFSETELHWWKSFGVSEKTLKKYNVYSCKSVFLDGRYLMSSSDKMKIFGYYGGKKKGKELWRLYFPQKKMFRFLSNWDKSMLQGSKQLPAEGSYLVIVKSLKDTMCLHDQNILACSPCSENILISKSQMSRLKIRFQKIFLFWDNDDPGREASKKYKEAFPDITCIELKPEISKDISDCCKKQSKVTFMNAIFELKEMVNHGKDSDLEYFNIL